MPFGTSRSSPTHSKSCSAPLHDEICTTWLNSSEPVAQDANRAQARDAGVRLVRFLYCDNGGAIRGKTTAVGRLADRIADGIGLTVAMMAMNSLDQLQPVTGMGPVGEIRLVPDPDSFDLQRENKVHLTFGGGPHRCLGSHLARIELKIAFPGLFTRFPKLRLAVPEDELPHRASLVIGGLERLPVAWE